MRISRVNVDLQKIISLILVTGGYIVQFDHFPPPSFEFFFPPTNKFAAGGAKRKFLEFMTPKDAFLRPFPPFLCNFRQISL